MPALGLESRDIQDGQLTASSSLDATHTAASGRLNTGGGWCAGANNELQYLQLDLLSTFTIAKVSHGASPSTTAVG